VNCAPTSSWPNFEDASTPNLNNMSRAIQPASAVHREIDYVDPQSGRDYNWPTRRPCFRCGRRRLHLPEKHMTVRRRADSGRCFDFGLLLLP